MDFHCFANTSNTFGSDLACHRLQMKKVQAWKFNRQCLKSQKKQSLAFISKRSQRRPSQGFVAACTPLFKWNRSSSTIRKRNIDADEVFEREIMQNLFHREQCFSSNVTRERSCSDEPADANFPSNSPASICKGSRMWALFMFVKCKEILTVFSKRRNGTISHEFRLGVFMKTKTTWC